jgi:hypothetical protein
MSIPSPRCASLARIRIVVVLTAGLLVVGGGSVMACVGFLSTLGDGCTAMNDPAGSPTYPKTCRWMARDSGGFTASGSWKVTITRAGHVSELQGSTEAGDIDRRPAVFQPGDIVDAEAIDTPGTASWVQVGSGVDNSPPSR